MTTRLIETVIRISIAHARARLSTKVQITDVEAASYLVDHSITVGGINDSEENLDENNDNVNLIQQKIDAFRTRNTSNGPVNNDSLIAKLISNANEDDINKSVTKDESRNVSKKLEVNLSTSKDNANKNFSASHFETVKVALMRILSTISESNEDILIEDIND